MIYSSKCVFGLSPSARTLPGVEDKLGLVYKSLPVSYNCR